MLNRILSIVIAALCVYLVTGILIKRVEPPSVDQNTPIASEHPPNETEAGDKVSPPHQDSVTQVKNNDGNTSSPEEQTQPASTATEVKPTYRENDKSVTTKHRKTDSSTETTATKKDNNLWSQEVLDDAESILSDIGQFTAK